MQGLQRPSQGERDLLRTFLKREWAGLAVTAILLFSFPPAFASEKEGTFSIFVRPTLQPPVHLFVADLFSLSQEEEVPQPGLGERVREYFLDTFPRHLLEGAQTSFFGRNLALLALAGGITGALLTVDDEIQDYFRDHRPIGSTARHVGDILGRGATLFGIAGTTYGLGEILNHRGLAKSGEIFIEGLSLTGVATGFLKVTTQRRRPNNSDTLSFPSGHSSGSFAFAAMLDSRFGHKAGLPAYLAAGFVSLSRLQKDKHFFSDTFFGAVLGTVVGYAVERIHRNEGSHRFVIAPLAGPEEIGLQVGFRF